MENLRENEIEDNMSMSPPSVGSMQIAGSNGFGHSMKFMSQAYLLNRYSEIDIRVQDSSFNQDLPFAVYPKSKLLCS
ncbi:ABC transporter G family member 26-like [Trifolium medium]|uniref:ABC transporter G family member 26-like n=1 Tax=Trifolium medium TaxID=97028 RepID=A0A392MY90_9FABA|nr:ABC transporter G family member 26-like [Trifolium medium]